MSEVLTENESIKVKLLDVAFEFVGIFTGQSNMMWRIPNKLGLSWAKLSCQLGFCYTVINIRCLISINMK